MHDVIAFLKDVVTRGPGAGIAGCYCVRGGSIYARNVRMQAGILWDAGGAEFNVPAGYLDDALARMKEIKEIRVEDDELIIKGGRMSVNIGRVHEEPQPPPDPPSGWRPVSPGLAAALGAARPYAGDRSWMEGIRIMGDRVTCFSHAAGIDISVPGLDVPKACLLTPDVAGVLAAQGDADEYAQEENAITFRWEDGRWLRAQYLYNEMPENIIVNLFEQAGKKTPREVTDDFRSALADAAALSDGNVEINAKGVKGLKEHSTVEVDVDTGVKRDHASLWKADVLIRAMEHADKWNPDAYPQPSLFVGDNVRGLVVGFKR